MIEFLSLNHIKILPKDCITACKSCKKEVHLDVNDA